MDLQSSILIGRKPTIANQIRIEQLRFPIEYCLTTPSLYPNALNRAFAGSDCPVKHRPNRKVRASRRVKLRTMKANEPTR
jgi:hypothetical protein